MKQRKFEIKIHILPKIYKRKIKLTKIVRNKYRKIECLKLI